MQYSATWRDKTGTVRWRNKSNWDFYEYGYAVRSASSDNGDEEPTTTADGWAARMCGMTKPDDSGVGYATGYANRNSFNPYKRVDQMNRDYEGEKKYRGGLRRNKSKMRRSRKSNKSKRRKSRKTNRRR
jgi:hypothetical protein